MNTHPELIVMLTYNDVTVPQAAEVFAKCEHTRARYWGFKEAGLPFAEMRDLFARMKACGKQTCLEVVAYTEAECLRGAEMAAACGCDFLLGTVFSEAVNAYCRAHGLRYMPFVGQVTGRPSVLEGTAEEMVCEAKRCLAQGTYGIDLLGYRYTGDAPALNRALTAAVGPVCIAGSVNSYARLAEIRAAGAAYFTIGSAFLTMCSATISPPRSTLSARIWRPTMLERWYPWGWAPNVFAIDYAKLQALGYKGILFDIDNTLVHHGADATPKVEALFRELDAMGMKTLLLSDNSAERIQRFNKHIGVPYIAEAGKPDPAAYRRGAKMLGLPVEQVVCIGDQVFRDIRGANRCGMASILVDFIRLPQETHYGKKRVLEKYIMACWRRNPRWRDRLGNIQK